MKKVIKVSDICLALDNPRLTDSQNEDEEIEKMVLEQNTKLSRLAEDIINHGLSPLDIIAVYPSKKNIGKYVVAEGNRRITVIKILNNPNIIANIDRSLFKKFSLLKVQYNNIDVIDAWLFENEDDQDLIHWIEIRHMGEQKGKGVVPWDGSQKGRFDKKLRGENALIDLWDELISYDVLNYDEIMSITKTNWERILRNTGTAFLGIYQEGNRFIIPKNDLIEFKKKMRAVFERLANQTVGIVYDEEKIKLFFEEISKELYGEIKKPINLQLNFMGLNEEKDLSINRDDFFSNTKIEDKRADLGQVPSPQTNNLSKNISKDIFNGCKTIIPNKYYLKTANTRLNKIIIELKTLVVDETPNACGSLLRILFELSAKVYLEKIGGNDETKTDFKPAIERAANDLRKKGLINNFEHSSIANDVDSLRNIFNGYMHNTDSYPSSEAIKSIFKAHKKFIGECLK